MNTMPYRDKEGGADFLLVVSGSTKDAPYLSSWREFKDHLRNVVKDQPGWVDVYSGQSYRPGEMQGWARLSHEADVDAAYGEYSRSKGMLVHVWETCRSGEGFLTFRHNCSSVFSEVSKGDHSAGCCGIDLGRMGHRTGGGGTPPYSTSTPQYMSTQTLYGYPYPPAQGYAVPVSYVSYAPSSQAPVYSTNSYEMPVNIRNGAVLTESRGIFIQNLNFGCSLSDLHSLLRTVGQPVHYTLNCDPRTGESKGHATATFASQEQAQRAAHSLNRVEHMGRMLTVRMDKETTAVGKIGSPLIVSSNMLYAVR